MTFEKYKLNMKQKILTIVGIVGGLLIIAKLFYGNFIATILIIPIGIIIYRIVRKKLYESRMRQMEIQFKDLLTSVSDLMQTGYSIENAFRESYKEMVQIYGKNSDICHELKTINTQVKLNVNIETVIAEFANRYDIESIQMFYQTFYIAKRTGGNMRNIIKNVCDTIALKEKIKEEIKVSINSKRLEQKVMMAIPVLLMVYVSFASPGFLDVMYSTIVGRLIMTACLGACLVAYLWGEKVISVEI